MLLCQARILEKDAITKSILMIRASEWMARVSLVPKLKKKKSVPSTKATLIRVTRIITKRRRKEAMLTQERPRETTSMKRNPSTAIITVANMATLIATDTSSISSTRTHSHLLSTPSN